MKELHTFIENMRSTSSANEKIEIIKNSHQQLILDQTV